MIKFLYSGNYTVDVSKSQVKSGEPPKPAAASSALFGGLFDSEAHSLDAATDASSELPIHTAIYVLAEEKNISEPAGGCQEELGRGITECVEQ
jgi:cation transport ATPase